MEKGYRDMVELFWLTGRRSSWQAHSTLNLGLEQCNTSAHFTRLSHTGDFTTALLFARRVSPLRFVGINKHVRRRWDCPPGCPFILCTRNKNKQAGSAGGVKELKRGASARNGRGRLTSHPTEGVALFQPKKGIPCCRLGSSSEELTVSPNNFTGIYVQGLGHRRLAVNEFMPSSTPCLGRVRY